MLEPERGSLLHSEFGELSSVTMPQPDASLVLIGTYPAEWVGKRFVIGRELRIGRDPSSEVHAELPELLRQHATVKRFGSQAFEVETLTPGAELYVNDRRVHFSVVAPGDVLAIGRLRFKLIVGEAAYHEEIYRLTITDALTGLHNKRYFQEMLERETIRAKRHARPLGLITFRVQALDRSSDGDGVLRAVATKLRANYAPASLARIGAAEFGVILSEVDLDQARACAARIAEQVPLTWSAVSLTADDADAAALLERATRSE